MTLLLVVPFTVAASAALDQPSRSSSAEVMIDAPRSEVWEALMDFEAYADWNPYMPSVRGRASVGERLKIKLHPPGGDADEISAQVFVFKPPRKLRWQSRLLMPGLHDIEYEVIVAPVGAERAYLVQRQRHEGLLALFVDSEAARAGLENMAAALKERVESDTRGAG